MNGQVIRVKMADYSIAKSPEILTTIGLGSCVGIAIYDSKEKIGGLIHIMLPENKKGLNPAKYADTGIPLLIEKMIKLGADRRKMVAKIAGGSQMFSMPDNTIGMRVGERNIEAVKMILAREKIKIVGHDLGENFGRTMDFYTENGKVVIRSYKRDDLVL